MAASKPPPPPPERDERREPAVEIDSIRFEREPLPDGLWRHHPVRYVIELARRRPRRPR